jgi:beta-galactosidase
MFIHLAARGRRNSCSLILLFVLCVSVPADAQERKSLPAERQPISLNEGWRFILYTGEPDKLVYDERPLVKNHNDNVVADTRLTDSIQASSSDRSLKKWIFTTGIDS